MKERELTEDEIESITPGYFTWLRNVRLYGIAKANEIANQKQSVSI